MAQSHFYKYSELRDSAVKNKFSLKRVIVSHAFTLSSFGLVFLGILVVGANGFRVPGGITVSDVFLFGGIALLSMGIVIEAKRPVVSNLGICTVFIIFVSVLLSSILARDPVASIENGMKLLAASALFPWLIVQVCEGRTSRVYALVFAWLIGVSINALIGVTDTLGVSSIGAVIGVEPFLGRANGLTMHPNHLSVVCGMSVPMFAYFSLHGGSRALRLIAWILLSSVLLGIAMAGSRAAVGAIAIVMLLILGMEETSVRRRAVFGAFLSILVGLLMVLLIWKSTPVSNTVSSPMDVIGIGLLRLLGQTEIGTSDIDRVEKYAVVTGNIDHSIIWGIGYENVVYGHSVPLQLVEAGGVVGASLMVIVAMVFSIRTIAALRVQKHEDKQLARGLTLGLVVWAIMGTTQNFVLDRFLYVPVGLLLACAAIRDKGQRTRRDVMGNSPIYY